MHAGRFRLTYACLRNATARVGEIARQPPSATSRRRRRRSQSHTVLELLLLLSQGEAGYPTLCVRCGMKEDPEQEEIVCVTHFCACAHSRFFALRFDLWYS
jgi:hypothetical protein